MYYEIRHHTLYVYSAPVQLNHQTLRFQPHTDADQRLLRFEMTVDPQPAGMSDLSDLDGNHARVAWFTGETTRFHVEATSVVETLRPNPFDYVWQGDMTLPLKYSGAYVEALGPYMARMAAPEIKEIGDSVARQVDGRGPEFLYRLTADLHQRFSRIVRPVGEPHDPLETLQRGEGSCRDLTVLYLAIARAQGFAGRFVSGYYAPAGSEDDRYDLHAWPEIYVPGGGWRGFDPTIGLAVADHHIGVAVGALPQQASPVTGTYAGSATSTLETYVTITEMESTPAG